MLKNLMKIIKFRGSFGRWEVSKNGNEIRQYFLLCIFHNDRRISINTQISHRRRSLSKYHNASIKSVSDIRCSHSKSMFHNYR